MREDDAIAVDVGEAQQLGLRRRRGRQHEPRGAQRDEGENARESGGHETSCRA